MPRVQDGDGYRLVCDQCALQSPPVVGDGIPWGFEQPPDTVGIFLCESCARMDVGQEDWLLRFPRHSLTDLDQRINLRAQIAALREDPNVRQVERFRPSAEDTYYVVSFVRLARAPHNEELAHEIEVHRTHRYDQRELSSLVQRLIARLQEAQQQEGGPELDFRPGSGGRTIVEVVARVIESGLTSLERTREDIYQHLTAQLGQPPGDNLVSLVERVVESAYEENRPRTTQEIREAVIRAFPQLARRTFDPTAMGSMINPLRQRLDYQSMGRRVFVVDQLPEGAIPSEQVVKEAWKVATLPEWCCVGLWVKRRLDGLVAIVEVIQIEEVLLRTYNLPGDWQGILSWDRTGDEGGVRFEAVWEPHTRPLAPTSWERILEGVL